MEKYQKVFFWTLTGIINIGLIIAWGLVEFAIRRRLGYATRGIGGHFAMFAGPVFFISMILSLLICKNFGISNFGRTVETCQRNPSSAPVTQSLELRSPPSQYGGLAIFLGVIAAGIALAVWRLPAVAGTKVYGYAVAAFFALIAALCLIEVAKRGDFIVKLDAEGVTGNLGSLPKTAHWSQIATWETTTHKTPYSTVVNSVLKDEAGKTLTGFSSSGGASEAEWKAFLDALQSQFLPAETPTDSGPPLEGVWPPPPQRRNDA